MKHLVKYETLEDYNNATLNRPQVSYIVDTGEVKYDPVIPYDKIIAYYDCSGKTNQDADRDTLKNLAGNSDYDLRLNNFAYAGMSGYGGFLEDFGSSWVKQVAVGTVSVTDNSITISEIKAVTSSMYYKAVAPTETLKFKIKISGLREGETLFFGTNITTNPANLEFPSNGEYEYEYTNTLSSTLNLGFRSRFIGADLDIRIEQLPEHPESLVFDGVDDYATSPVQITAFENNRYTVIPIFTSLIINTNGILVRKGNFRFGDRSNVTFRWWNIHSSLFETPFRKGLIALTARKPVYNDDTEYEMQYISEKDIPGYLLVGGLANNNFYKCVVRGLIILNGVNLDYRQCEEILEQFHNKTLIDKV